VQRNWVWLILMSKRVRNSKEVANNITRSCFVLIATVTGQYGKLIQDGKKNLIGSWAVQILRYRPRPKLFNDNRWHAPFAHLPRCTCKFFRLLLKDGCRNTCRILQCLYMKLNGGSRVHRWHTHRYLWVIRNTAKHKLLCNCSTKRALCSEERSFVWIK